ncbi:hypothetical protein SAMN04515695_4589 [Pseudovibrio sp. Tun.PSC04-5.I4]|nr:hypothetical protein SAMN04515695_4589 [Pseudovibrio sp. Tun.PSC04-5.I4]
MVLVSFEKSVSVFETDALFFVLDDVKRIEEKDEVIGGLFLLLVGVSS